MRANLPGSRPNESTSSSALPSWLSSNTASSSEPSRLMMISWMAASTWRRSRLRCSDWLATNRLVRSEFCFSTSTYLRSSSASSSWILWVMGSSFADQALDLGQELERVDGLGDVVVAAGRIAGLDVERLSAGGDHDHRDGLRFGLRADAAAGLEAVHLR